ncbi:hypothetical protein V5F44_14550 [Xanthobacter sp. V2C-8]|uniref:hypothetical protein n=1 Tax=Xanthobacter albus TaxID=3119929 RepID=UPI0037291A02
MAAMVAKDRTTDMSHAERRDDRGEVTARAAQALALLETTAVSTNPAATAA